MPNYEWSPVASSFSVTTRTEFNVPWQLAAEDFLAFNVLRITASGAWRPFAGLAACGPDGLLGATYSDSSLILTDCAVGALLGRVGGSSASLKSPNADAAAGETKPFPIGAYCVIQLPEKTFGPLFIGFNNLIRPVLIDKLTLVVEGLNVPRPPPATEHGTKDTVPAKPT